jgi:hypothetical protein
VNGSQVQGPCWQCPEGAASCQLPGQGKGSAQAAGSARWPALAFLQRNCCPVCPSASVPAEALFIEH